jgi:hypothetical protein
MMRRVRAATRLLALTFALAACGAGTKAVETEPEAGWPDAGMSWADAAPTPQPPPPRRRDPVAFDASSM